MGITSTLYTALSGLNASQARLDVSGNNVANVNTVAYKGSRATFETQLSRTMSFGSPAAADSGGTNPIQFGLGVNVGSIQRDFGAGSIETTGVNTDVAIEGNGFFVLQRADSSEVYTRDGTFKLDANQKLVNADGHFVLGYGIDSNFELVPGLVSDVTIPLGRSAIAQATTEATFDGNLDAAGTVATTPATATSELLIDSGGGTPIVAGTSLTSLATAVAPGVNLFAVNDVITLTAEKGGRNLPTQTFTVTAAATGDVDSGATIGEVNEWLEAKLGINTTVAQVPPAGITITPAGQIEITGNLGPDNDLEIELASSGAVPRPFSWTTTAGDGTGAHTSFQVYDSIGNGVNVNMTFALVNKATTGNTWRFYAESYDDSDDSPVVGSGTVTFDTSGFVANTADTNIVINRADTGAVDPLSVSLDLSALTGLTTGSTVVRMNNQDGFPAGTLNDFAIGKDGTITGTFSNGLTRTLGQLALATFSNQEGLVAEGSNTFVAGPNSGEPSIVAPGTMGAGVLIGGALELSNVDLTRQFIDMITATTAFSSAGRVISTSQQLLGELLATLR